MARNRLLRRCLRPRGCCKGLGDFELCGSVIARSKEFMRGLDFVMKKVIYRARGPEFVGS